MLNMDQSARPWCHKLWSTFALRLSSNCVDDLKPKFIMLKNYLKPLTKLTCQSTRQVTSGCVVGHIQHIFERRETLRRNFDLKVSISTSGHEAASKSRCCLAKGNAGHDKNNKQVHFLWVKLWQSRTYGSGIENKIFFRSHHQMNRNDVEDPIISTTGN